MKVPIGSFFININFPIKNPQSKTGPKLKTSAAAADPDVKSKGQVKLKLTKKNQPQTANCTNLVSNILAGIIN